jgi:hypothetical protein
MVAGEDLVEDEGVLVVVGAMEEVAEVVVEVVVAPRPTYLPLKRVSLLLCLGNKLSNGSSGRRESLPSASLHLMGKPPTPSVTFPTTPTWAKVLRHKLLHPNVGIT